MSVFRYSPSCTRIPQSSIYFEVLKDGTDLPHVPLVEQGGMLKQRLLELASRVEKYSQQDEYIINNENKLESLISDLKDDNEAVQSRYVSTSSLPYITIGRVPTCHMVVEHASLSRVHGVLEFGPQGEQFLSDQSTHGIKLNKVFMEKHVKVRLYNGDTQKFGDSSRMHVLNYADERERGDVEDNLGQGYVLKAVRDQIAKKEELKVDTVVISDEDEEQAQFDLWVRWDGEEEIEEALLEKLAVNNTCFMSALLFIGKTVRQKDLCASYLQAKDRLSTAEEALTSVSSTGMSRNANLPRLRGNVEKAEKQVEVTELAVKGSFRAKLKQPNSDSFAWNKSNDEEDDVADATHKFKESTTLGFYALMKRNHAREPPACKRMKGLDGSPSVLSCLSIDLTDKTEVQNEIERLEAELEFNCSVLKSHQQQDEQTAALDAAASKRGGNSMALEAQKEVDHIKRTIRELESVALNLGAQAPRIYQKAISQHLSYLVTSKTSRAVARNRYSRKLDILQHSIDQIE